MPISQELKTRWLHDLRSGEYTQVRDVLRNEENMIPGVLLKRDEA